MVRRKAVTSGVASDVRDPEGLSLANDQPEQAMAARQGADRSRALASMPLVMKRSMAAVLSGNPQRRVLCLREFSDPVDDRLKDQVEAQQPRNALDRHIECGKVRLCAAGPQLPAQVHGAPGLSPIFTPLA